MTSSRPMPTPLLSIGATVTPDEAAQVIGCTPATLAKWRAHGKGPAFYKPTGKRVIYALRDIEAWFIATRQGGMNANTKPRGPVALPILGAGTGVQRQYRLGRHRTREEARRENG